MIIRDIALIIFLSVMPVATHGEVIESEEFCHQLIPEATELIFHFQNLLQVNEGFDIAHSKEMISEAFSSDRFRERAIEHGDKKPFEPEIVSDDYFDIN